MKRSIIVYAVSIVMLLSLLAAQTVLAESDFTDLDHGNDPVLAPDANACFDGGTLAGKCDSEALWRAGWFLIRLEHGVIHVEDFPAEYAWVLSDNGEADNSHDSGTDHEEEICLDPAPENSGSHEG